MNALDKNINRLCSPKIFAWAALSHIRAGQGKSNFVTRGVALTVSYLTAYASDSLYVGTDGCWQNGSRHIPEMIKRRVNIQFSPGERLVYERQEKECGKKVSFDLLQSHSRLPDSTALGRAHPQEQARKLEPILNQLVVNATHPRLHCFRKMKTAEIQRWDTEGLPALVYRMLAKQGRTEVRLEDEETILRLFLRNTPKFRVMLADTINVIASKAENGSEQANLQARSSSSSPNIEQPQPTKSY